ncbi:MAG: hypothetical protein HFE84_10960 [Lachnospiraceae bacterium]|nr:hypothetical protein [Lachnospiraceae bacterium]
MQPFFEQALANFTFEAACGGAIRHLADNGYTIRQIMKKLDYPASYEQVQNSLLAHFLGNGTLLKNEPDFTSIGEKPDFILEYGPYGKASFRQTAAGPPSPKPVWREVSCLPGSFFALLERKLSENGPSFSYVSCDFGLQKDTLPSMLAGLDERQQDYIEGIPWKPARMYHRLTPRMKEILVCLSKEGVYPGICYFLKTGEKLIL